MVLFTEVQTQSFITVAGPDSASLAFGQPSLHLLILGDHIFIEELFRYLCLLDDGLSLTGMHLFLFYILFK